MLFNCRPFRLLGIVVATQLCYPQAVSQQERQCRITFADEHFAARSIPGSQTDRGKVYVALGRL